MVSNPTDRLTPAAPDVSIVVTAHHEGVLAHATFMSLAHACRTARQSGLHAEVVVVLDRPDDPTSAYVGSVVDDGVFNGCADVRVLEVDQGDVGLSRNSGLRVARGAIAGPLDADNLVSRNWLVAGVEAVRAAPDAVIHPEWTVSFGGRRTLWPMIATADTRFRPELLQGHNYWDAFSLARRSLYLDFPYHVSGPGWGPEDWHWNIQTVAAGVSHIAAPQTALFYRIKGAGSLMSQHEASGHVLAPAAMLTSRELAVAAIKPQSVPDVDSLAGDTLDVVRRVVAAPVQPYLRLAPALEGAGFDAAHYRVLNRDLRGMTHDELTAHRDRFGRNEARRTLLTAEESSALAHWRPEHYALLNPDLSGLDDDTLLDHFLHHGLKEDRQGWIDEDGVVALARLRVGDYVALNPDLSGLTPEEAVAHFARDGRAQGRPTVLPPPPPEPPDWLRELWADVRGFEPAIPAPTEQVLWSYSLYGHAPDVEPAPTHRVWWELVARTAHSPGKPEVLLLVERLDRPGLDEHLAAVCALSPELAISVVVTGLGDGSTLVSDETSLPGAPYVLRLADVPGFPGLDDHQRARLVAELVVQLSPRVLHLWGPGLALDAFEWHAAAMSRQLVVHLTVDGEGLTGDDLSHPLLGRRPGYLGPVAAVWVDRPSTVDRLWEMARLPRDKFVVRPPSDQLTDLLSTMPGYGPDDPFGPERVYGSEATARLLAGTVPVVLVVTGYEGFANFGDILQAKSLSRWWRARGVTPVHLVSAGAVRSGRDLDACRRDVASQHVLVSWSNEGEASVELGLVRVREVSSGTLLHVGGGGYLNRHWHRQRMQGIWSLVDLAAPSGLVVSGVQVDKTAVEPLSELFALLPPAVIGARDERSRVLLAGTTNSVEALASFDDATEVILEWADADDVHGHSRPARSPATGTRIGLHLNTSHYAAHHSVLEVVRAALVLLRERDPSAGLTVLQAYDDDRVEVADSLSTLPRFRAHFPFDHYQVVDLAQAARALDLDHDVVPSLASVRELDLAIVASYHTAVLLGLLGVPTHLLATNSFYEDKAAGLGQFATLEEFLDDPRGNGIALDPALQLRKTWLSGLDGALGALGAASPRGGDR